MLRKPVTRAGISLTRGETNSTPPHESAFREVLDLIESARQRAFQAVNTELIDLYWQVGEYISRKLESAVWGEGVVDQLAGYISRHHPDIHGFTRRNLFRMRQFYETYRHDKKVSPLVTQLPWTHHLLILGKAKREEEREFYLRLATREKWPSRELERQINGCLFERAIRNPPKRPSIGALLCATKDNEVVEYALSRSLSPALIAKYQTALPDKQLLQRKLHEFYQLALPATEAPKAKPRKPRRP